MWDITLSTTFSFEPRQGKKKKGESWESQKIKNLAYLYKLCLTRQQRQKQIFKLLSFTYY